MTAGNSRRDAKAQGIPQTTGIDEQKMPSDLASRQAVKRLLVIHEKLKRKPVTFKPGYCAEVIRELNRKA